MTNYDYLKGKALFVFSLLPRTDNFISTALLQILVKKLFFSSMVSYTDASTNTKIIIFLSDWKTVIIILEHSKIKAKKGKKKKKKETQNHIRIAHALQRMEFFIKGEKDQPRNTSELAKRKRPTFDYQSKKRSELSKRQSEAKNRTGYERKERDWNFIEKAAEREREKNLKLKLKLKLWRNWLKLNR